MMRCVFLFVMVFTSTQLFAKVLPKVIYGIDNRAELNNTPRTMFETLGRSTAAMVRDEALVLDSSGGSYSLAPSVKTLKESLRLCSKERFGDQPFLASCSGFLVAENILVTAGHCYQGMMNSACDDHVWVFDYKLEDETRPFSFSFPKENVYRCKRVLKAVLNSSDRSDYSIIELDRKVTDRLPLRLRKSGAVKVGEQVTVIGHPWGLPSKIAEGGKILHADQSQYFTTTLDTFQGNSGSAVFNSQTGIVEGILVRGRSDALMSFGSDEGVCRTLNVCNEDGSSCSVKDENSKGEDVSRITVVAAELTKLGL
ncbi:MAG: trypsin-like peptidase domain-containing protein [Bdellovibrio sp.]|nr:trypsin-like peptidase domain-containing protein [Bdellovibrio sp.]